jgi:hypothetical protein
VLYANGTQAPWTKPDVSAPGIQITSASAGMEGDRYTVMSGTSQAAPHVSGLAAMVRTQHEDLSALEVQQVIENAARDVGDDGPDPDTGHGMVSASNTLELAAQAANGTLFATEEYYQDVGRIAADNPTKEYIEDEDGYHTGNASETFPVKPSATRLDLTINWTPAETGVPVPDMDVSIENPSGARLLVPIDGMEATRTFEDPAQGEWTWHLQAIGVGMADYQANATVTLDVQPAFAAGGDASGDFFDQGFSPQQFLEDLSNLEREAVVVAGAGVGVLALVGAAFRGSVG